VGEKSQLTISGAYLCETEVYMIVFKTTLRRIFYNPLNIFFIMLFPMIFFLLSGLGSDDPVEDVMAVSLTFGVVDQDGSALSQALVGQLETRYNVRELYEHDIAAALTESEIGWVLLIREGFGRDVLARRAPVLESYYLTITDVSALGSVTAQNITRALILLGTDDPVALAEWSEASLVEVRFFEDDNWAAITMLLGFFGFISLFTAYFIIRTLLDDKRGGMPDRLGVLPQYGKFSSMEGWRRSRRGG